MSSDEKHRARLGVMLSLMMGIAGLAFTPQVYGEQASRADELDAVGDVVVSQTLWTVQSYGSVTLGVKGGDLYLAHAGVGYEFLENLHIQLEAVGGYSDPDHQDGGGAYGLDLRFRWDYWHSDDGAMRAFMDAGSGLLWTEHTVPAGGTHQNFTPQVGWGFDWQMSDTTDLIAGVRWHHISNASKTGSDRNPGYDGVMIFAGLAMRF